MTFDKTPRALLRKVPNDPGRPLNDFPCEHAKRLRPPTLTPLLQPSPRQAPSARNRSRQGGIGRSTGTPHGATGGSPGPAAGGRIAASATSETMVWGTQQNGSYRSTDHGTTWTPITTLPKSILIGGNNVFSTGPRFPLAADKVNGEKFYAYHYGRVYLSADAGETFAPVATLPNSYPTDPLTLETTPGKEGDIWIGIAKQGLFHSTDSDATWTDLGTPAIASLRSAWRPTAASSVVSTSAPPATASCRARAIRPDEPTRDRSVRRCPGKKFFEQAAYPRGSENPRGLAPRNFRKQEPIYGRFRRERASPYQTH